MFKFAFFVNSETLTPENYKKELHGEGFEGLVCGVNSLELACETAKKLAEEGFEEIDLCGDFDAEKAKTIQGFAGDKIEVWHETFTKPEEEKFEKLTQLNPWGIIIHVGSKWEKDSYTVLKSAECDTYIACVDGMDETFEAAKRMVADGVTFIEICSYYNEEMCNQIVESIGGAIPIGFPIQA